MKAGLIALTVIAMLIGGAYILDGNSPQAETTSQEAQSGIQLIATSGCYAAGCNGKNPAGLCDDGITVAAKQVTNGLLELRYSRSCKANWGRYTPWNRDAVGYFLQAKGIYARVTAWDSGGPSYDTAHHDLSWNSTGSSWSQMVDGTKTACTGVEVVIVGKDNADSESQGWSWGPCY